MIDYTIIIRKPSVSARYDEKINQKQGVINKCPNCGGALKALSSTCNLCGHELVGVAANKTISDLVEKFDVIESEVTQTGAQGVKREKEIILRKARVIRDFPVPNSREDLQSLIYFIHPKIQDNIKPDPNVDDWRVKFTEVLNLAKNAYKGDAKTRFEFDEIEKSLNTTISSSLQKRAKRYPIVAGGISLVVVLVVIGLISSQMDKLKLIQCEEKYTSGVVAEKARLDGIVALIEEKHKEKKYSDAITSLNKLRWEYQESCKESESKYEQARWDEKNRVLTALIQKSEAVDVAQTQMSKASDAAQAQMSKASDAAQKRAIAQRELAKKDEEAERVLEEKLTVSTKDALAARRAATHKE